MNTTRLLTETMLATIVFAVGATLAQSPSTTIRGGWSATAGPNQVLQGSWTAEPTAGNPNGAQGTWTLLRSNQIAAQGTWSAVKTAKEWSGTWQARVVTSAGATTQLLSGSWRTQVTNSDVGSLSELLRQTLREQVSGAWASGRLAGAWSLRAYQ